jgi:hypothetical protein
MRVLPALTYLGMAEMSMRVKGRRKMRKKTDRILSPSSAKIETMACITPTRPAACSSSGSLEKSGIPSGWPRPGRGNSGRKGGRKKRTKSRRVFQQSRERSNVEAGSAPHSSPRQCARELSPRRQRYPAGVARSSDEAETSAKRVQGGRAERGAYLEDPVDLRSGMEGRSRTRKRRPRPHRKNRRRSHLRARREVRRRGHRH